MKHKITALTLLSLLLCSLLVHAGKKKLSPVDDLSILAYVAGLQHKNKPLSCGLCLNNHTFRLASTYRDHLKRSIHKKSRKDAFQIFMCNIESEYQKANPMVKAHPLLQESP